MLKDSVLKLYFYGKQDDLKIIIGISEDYSLKRLLSKINQMTEEQQKDVEEYLNKLTRE